MNEIQRVYTVDVNGLTLEIKMKRGTDRVWTEPVPISASIVVDFEKMDSYLHFETNVDMSGYPESSAGHWDPWKWRISQAEELADGDILTLTEGQMDEGFNYFNVPPNLEEEKAILVFCTMSTINTPGLGTREPWI